jgi:hypothetical protein
MRLYDHKFTDHIVDTGRSHERCDGVEESPRSTTMLIGAHVILYSKNAEADRVFLRDVLRLSNVDVGGGWLIFALPTSEVAIHPADNDAKHELYLMCADISDLIKVMQRHGIECGPVSDERWGLLTQLRLPGGGQLGVYEPRHPRPKPVP